MSETPAKVRVTAGDIRAALRACYGQNSAVLFEVGSGTGAGNHRHIDAIAVGLWPSRGMEIEGVEIKISRSDWKRELDDHAKADAIQRYCDRWWIAAPKGLIPPAELPATWGLMEFDSGSLRTKVKAPKLDALPLTRAFVAAMLRRAAQADKEELDAMLAKDHVAIRESERKRALDMAPRVAAEADAIVRRASEIKAATGIDLMGWCPTEDVAHAIKVALTINLHGFGGMEYVGKQAQTLANEIRKFGIQLDQASEPTQ